MHRHLKTKVGNLTASGHSSIGGTHSPCHRSATAHFAYLWAGSQTSIPSPALSMNAIHRTGGLGCGRNYHRAPLFTGARALDCEGPLCGDSNAQSRVGFGSASPLGRTRERSPAAASVVRWPTISVSIQLTFMGFDAARAAERLVPDSVSSSNRVDRLQPLRSRRSKGKRMPVQEDWPCQIARAGRWARAIDSHASHSRWRPSIAAESAARCNSKSPVVVGGTASRSPEQRGVTPLAHHRE